MGDRLIFDTDSDPGMDVVAVEGGLSFNSMDHWCGDSIRGFGASVNIELTPEQVAELAAALNRWLAENGCG